MEWSAFAIWAFVYIFHLLSGVSESTRQIVDIVALVLLFISWGYPLYWRRVP